jgi:hypothetical protein
MPGPVFAGDAANLVLVLGQLGSFYRLTPFFGHFLTSRMMALCISCPI